MKTTSALVLINSNGDILGCHAFGKPKDKGWDFPKGLTDENETDIDAAVRECFEETGLKVDKSVLVDCGVYPHNKEKNIHIFLYKTESIPMFGLNCTSFFERNGKEFPEVDAWMVIPKEKRYLFNKVLQDKFNIIDKYNEN